MANEQIRFAASDDTPAVRSLWEICFPAEDHFNDYFFDRIYQPHCNLLLLRDGAICAMTQMLPHTLVTDGVEEAATYIYGACTHPDCRRQHLMARLLHRSFEIDRQAGRAASLLIPQEDWLYAFYESFGYRTCFYTAEQRFEKDNCQMEGLFIRPMEMRDLPAVCALYDEALRGRSTIVRPVDFWRQQIDLFDACGCGAFCAVVGEQVVGYAFVWPMKDGLWAQECVALPRWRQAFVAALLQRLGGQKCRITGPYNESVDPIGCMLRYDGKAQPDGYLNLMLN